MALGGFLGVRGRCGRGLVSGIGTAKSVGKRMVRDEKPKGRLALGCCWGGGLRCEGATNHVQGQPDRDQLRAALDFIFSLGLGFFTHLSTSHQHPHDGTCTHRSLPTVGHQRPRSNQYPASFILPEALTHPPPPPTQHRRHPARHPPPHRHARPSLPGGTVPHVHFPAPRRTSLLGRWDICPRKNTGTPPIPPAGGRIMIPIKS